MNNAEAERGALDVLFERVSEGGMIVFDDYGWTGYREQKDAADAFMRQYSLYGTGTANRPGACCKALITDHDIGSSRRRAA